MGLIDGGFLFIRASLFSSFSTPRETNGTEIILNLNGLHALVITFLQGVFRYRQMSHDQYFKMQINDIVFFSLFYFSSKVSWILFFPRKCAHLIFHVESQKKETKIHWGTDKKKLVCHLLFSCSLLSSFSRSSDDAAVCAFDRQLSENEQMPKTWCFFFVCWSNSPPSSYC